MPVAYAQPKDGKRLERRLEASKFQTDRNFRPMIVRALMPVIELYLYNIHKTVGHDKHYQVLFSN